MAMYRPGGSTRGGAGFWLGFRARTGDTRERGRKGMIQTSGGIVMGGGWISAGSEWPGLLELGKGVRMGLTEFSGIGRPLGQVLTTSRVFLGRWSRGLAGSLY